MIYAINYDLKTPDRDYAGLYEAIKRCGAWWHYLDSTWLIDSRLGTDAIWRQLAPHVHGNDYVLVIGVSAGCQGWLPEEAWKWIGDRIAAMAE